MESREENEKERLPQLQGSKQSDGRGSPGSQGY